MFKTIIIGEEVGTKVKAYLIAPEGTNVLIGEIVVANGLKFTVQYVDRYCSENNDLRTFARVALGRPIRVTEIIRTEQVKWSEEDDVDG